MAAALWNVLREEVRGTVDDFKQKGVAGTFRDAALDAMDMAKDAGGMVAEGVKRTGVAAVGTGEMFEGEAYLVGPNIPKREATAELHFINGESVEATIIDVDGVSDPPRARVTAAGMEEPVVVPILDPQMAEELIASGALESNGPLSLLHRELSTTFQELREKGAVGAFKDATLDIVDIGTDTAKSAVDVAKVVAPTLTGATTAAVGYIGDTAKSAVDTAKTTAAYGVATEHAGSLINGIKDEWKETVQELRDKGAVGTVRDAAFDAADLIGTTASSAATTASGVVSGPTARAVMDHAGTTASSALETASTVVNNATSHASKLLGRDGVADSEPTAPASGENNAAPAEGAAVPAAMAAAAAEAAAGVVVAEVVAGVAAASAATTAAAVAASQSKTIDGESPPAASPTVEHTSTPAAKPFNPPERAQVPKFSGPSAESRAQEKTAPAPAAETTPLPTAPSAGLPEQEKSAPAQMTSLPMAKVSAPEAEAAPPKSGRKSLVSMRRNMFEKTKASEPKTGSEELID